MKYELIKKMISAGLGLAIFTKEKAYEIIQDWVNEGQISKAEGEILLESWIDRIESEREEIGSKINAEVAEIIDKAGFVTRKCYSELEEKVQNLELRIISLEQKQKSMSE
ncbi:MAG: hypothetical protein GX994_08625 [Firmicutes bacterium]|nr:hypothetical protein [Bacillota bacterium]